MRIGILIDRLNVGGVEKIAIEEVRALRELGEDAYLVVLRKKAVTPDAFPDLLKNIPVIYLDQRLPKFMRFSFRIPLFHFFSLFHITYPFLLPFVVKRKEFDYLIAHGTYTSLSAVAFKKFNNIHFSSFIWDPVTYIIDRVYTESRSPHTIKFLRFFSIKLDRFLIDNMDNVLAGGTAHNKFIKKLNSVKKIEVIYPSVHPISKPVTKDDYVLVVTAWKRGKHPEYLIKIAETMPTIHIKMVGRWVDPAYETEFKKLINKNELTNQIEVVGMVTEEQLMNLYAQARVLLQTNDDKGFGMPAIEAAAQGTTFIIPEGQGVCDLFTDTEDGYYTKEKDTETITMLLNKLVSNKGLAEKMGTSALTKVKKNYSWTKHAQTLISVINRSANIK